MVELATHLQAPNGKVTQESTNWEEPGTSKIKSVLCDRAYQNVENQPLPSTSRCVTPPPLAVPLVSSCPDKDDITPGKLLQSINPIPVVTPSLRKRTKQLAAILTSPENIAEVKAKALKRKKPTKKITNTKRTKKVAPKKMRLGKMCHRVQNQMWMLKWTMKTKILQKIAMLTALVAEKHIIVPERWKIG